MTPDTERFVARRVLAFEDLILIDDDVSLLLDCLPINCEAEDLFDRTVLVSSMDRRDFLTPKRLAVGAPLALDFAFVDAEAAALD